MEVGRQQFGDAYLAAYGAAVRDLLENPDRARAIGREAMERVRGDFLAVRSLLQYFALFEKLLS